MRWSVRTGVPIFDWAAQPLLRARVDLSDDQRHAPIVPTTVRNVPERRVVPATTAVPRPWRQDRTARRPRRRRPTTGWARTRDPSQRGTRGCAPRAAHWGSGVRIPRRDPPRSGGAASYRAATGGKQRDPPRSGGAASYRAATGGKQRDPPLKRWGSELRRSRWRETARRAIAQRQAGNSATAGNSAPGRRPHRRPRWLRWSRRRAAARAAG